MREDSEPWDSEMTKRSIDREPPTDRESPVGSPVVRGDAAITGERAREATAFNPDDPDSLEHAAQTVRSFADANPASGDHIFMLEGAAACAALVRGEGSYKAAAERAGGDATVSFIRKWARVHDLPQAVRRHVARGDIAPSAAKHIARVRGDARFQLAWATLDHDLTVREIRRLASSINDTDDVASALAGHDITLGEMTMELPLPVYRELRRVAANEDREPGAVVADALAAWLAEE